MNLVHFIVQMILKAKIAQTVEFLTNGLPGSNILIENAFKGKAWWRCGCSGRWREGSFGWAATLPHF